MGTLRRFSTVAIAALLVAGLAACGDDGSDDTSSDAGSTEGASDETTADDSDDMSDDDSDGDSGGGGEVGATVTIDGETYEANNQQVCVTMGGAMGASFVDDSGDITIQIDMPPPDWESDTQSDWSPPYVRVDDDREDPIKQWEGGGDDFLGNAPETSIDDYSIEGNSTSGSGTFVDIYNVIGGGDAAVVDGTFEATCE